ncbi:response regulator transcription factor [Sediminibacillus massiliensis]|uniref:response regulator transcription factor n=1 Tax=Sediminibacillus massiliensis TaxID=1926277 RepID=UPI0009888ED1|nr:response regulator [Sediminibacillus massiliensis]
MTYKMLIVDDEPIICRGLKETIPWQEAGVEVVDVAYDGNEAIEKLQRWQSIDFVITDVRMPNKDGLELARYLAENRPSVRTIMISGYDEFKYAQQAIHLGVKDYLLKPVDVDELLHVVHKLIEQLEEEKKESRSFLFSSIRNAIYTQVFDYPVKKEDSFPEEDVTVFPFLTMIGNYGSLLDQSIDGTVENIKLDWKQKLDQHLFNSGLESISIFTGENILLTCVLAKNSKELSADDCLPIIKEAINDQSFSLLFVLNQTTVQLHNLGKVYKGLRQDVEYLAVVEQGIIVSPFDQSILSKNQPYPNEIESDLIDSVFQNQGKTADFLESLFAYLKEHRFLLKEVVPYCSEIVSNIRKRAEKLLKRNTGDGKLNFERRIDLTVYNSYELVEDLFIQDIERLMKEFELWEIDRNDWMIERAEEYIKTYYASDLRAQEVADVINISPNYFSSLFKQRTGKNFTEYINEIRVEKAKALLEETPFKVHEIAEQVGYHEYKYFVEVFKRFSGTTPTKYRKMTVNRLS